MCPIKHKNNGKRYNDDFRKMIVDLYHLGQSIKNLSSEYGASEVTIYAWIKKFTPMDLEDGSSITSDDYAKLKNKCSSNKRKMISLKKL